jgi:hypothetical protein
MSTQLQHSIGWPLVWLLVTLQLQWITSPAAASAQPATVAAAGFNESLLLRPLHDGKIMMHWQFEVRTKGNGRERKEEEACNVRCSFAGEDRSTGADSFFSCAVPLCCKISNTSPAPDRYGWSVLSVDGMLWLGEAPERAANNREPEKN